MYQLRNSREKYSCKSGQLALPVLHMLPQAPMRMPCPSQNTPATSVRVRLLFSAYCPVRTTADMLQKTHPKVRGKGFGHAALMPKHG
jgi:hypothetical protein